GCHVYLTFIPTRRSSDVLSLPILKRFPYTTLFRSRTQQRELEGERRDHLEAALAAGGLHLAVVDQLEVVQPPDGEADHLGGPGATHQPGQFAVVAPAVEVLGESGDFGADADVARATLQHPCAAVAHGRVDLGARCAVRPLRVRGGRSG